MRVGNGWSFLGVVLVLAAVASEGTASASCSDSVDVTPQSSYLGARISVIVNPHNSDSTATPKGCTIDFGGLGHNLLSSGDNRWEIVSTTVGTYQFTATCTWWNPLCTSTGRSAPITVLPDPPAPTVSLTASPMQITAGQGTYLYWSTTNATSCTASGAWSGSKATSGGPYSLNPNQTSTYTLTCLNALGVSGSGSVTVTVLPTPTLSISASPTKVAPAGASTLTWVSANTSSCTASGSWSGSKPISGSEVVHPMASSTYGISCVNGIGTAVSGSAAVTVVPLPTVSLSASPSSIAAGATSTLTWSSTNASSCAATGSWSGAKSLTGSANVAPSVTSTYTLECNNAVGAGSASTTVTIVPAPSVSISASPTEVGTGGPSVLTWSSTDATGCAAGGAWSGSKGTSGSTTVFPGTTSTYTISCSGIGGQSPTKSATVTVVPTPTVSLAANPLVVPQGGSSTLSWSSTNATGCGAGGSWSGAKPPSGSESVTINATSTYTLTCSGTGGTSSLKSVTVEATAPPTVSLSAFLPTIATGGTSTLTWTALNATSCQASGAWAGSRTTSGAAQVTPTTTSTYTLSCSGAGGSQSASATVTVQPGFAVNLGTQPSTISEGEYASLAWSVGGAASCIRSGAWEGALSESSGTQRVTPAQTARYDLTCTDAGGAAKTAEAFVHVNPNAAYGWAPPIRLPALVNGVGTYRMQVSTDASLSITGIVFSSAAPAGVPALYGASHGSGGDWTKGWLAPEALPAPITSAQGEAGMSESGASPILTILPTKDLATFASWRAGGSGALDLWMAMANGNAWSAPTNLAAVNSSGNEYSPSISPERRWLYFVSDRGDGAYQGDIYVAKTSASLWDTVTRLDAPINTAFREESPFLTEDESRLYFASDRAGSGIFRIYYADGVGAGWGQPVLLGPEVNIPGGSALSPALTPDGSRIYFLSDVGNGAGNFDVYESVRTSLDTDGDGIRDSDTTQPNGIGDNCWDVANPDQADQDRDGIGDACEPAGGCGSVAGRSGFELWAAVVALAGLACGLRLRRAGSRR